MNGSALLAPEVPGSSRVRFWVLGAGAWVLTVLPSVNAADLKYPGDVKWVTPLVQYSDYAPGHVVGVVPFVPRFLADVALSTAAVVSPDKKRSCFYAVRGSSAPTYGTYRETGGPMQLFTLSFSSSAALTPYPMSAGPLGRNQAISMTLLVAKATKPRMYSEEDAFYCGPPIDFAQPFEVHLRWPADKGISEKVLTWPKAVK